MTGSGGDRSLGVHPGHRDGSGGAIANGPASTPGRCRTRRTSRCRARWSPRRRAPRAPGHRAPGRPRRATSSPTSWPAASDSSHFSSSTSQYAWSGSRAGPMAGARIARLGCRTSRIQISAATSGATGLPPLSSSQAWCSCRSLSRSRACPSSATSPVNRWSSRAWNRRLATATRRRTASPPDVGSRLISSTAKPRSLSRRSRARDGMPVVGLELRFEMELVPQRGVARADRFGGLHGVVERVRPALHRPEVGQSEPDVLDEDVEIERALPVRQGGVDLARLGVHQIGLDLVAVPSEQGVRQRAVAPEHARAMEVDEQRRHRVQQPVAIRAGPQREAHQEAPVLDRVGQVFGRQDGRVAGDRIGQADGGDRREPRAFEPPEHIELRGGDLARLLFQGVGTPVEDEEPHEVTRRADRQVTEVERLRWPPRERDLPRQIEQPGAALAQPKPRQRDLTELGRTGLGCQSFLRR